ncbi:MAG: ATP-dependent DNA helicase RecG [Paracoccaceae bacterium]|nr:ATP-dependent DNA helicase RecG [Paracoccaceae bacterium]MDG2259151.1 ATP-dependent DNA helicase RecG [Paracoccaceae bacterium]
MSGRPEKLFPLFSNITKLDGIGPKSAQALASIGIEKPKDLLVTLPASGIDRHPRQSVQGALQGEVVTVEVIIESHQPSHQKGRPYRVTVIDTLTSFQLVFFHARADYLTKLLPTGQKRIVSGKVEYFDGVGQIAHPDHVVAMDQASEIPEFEPVYPLTSGVTQKTMQKASISAQELAPKMPEWIDNQLHAQNEWPTWNDALALAHNPKSVGDLSPNSLARTRLAYDEFLAHQLTLALARQDALRKPGIATIGTGEFSKRVWDSLPYLPTNAQKRSIDEISTDMAADIRMNRLLQGDVGSGKTLVAFMALIAAVEAGGQGVMMAPTGILAQQHLEGLQPLAEDAGVVLEILTGRDKGTERRSKLTALARGDIQILVGTHAVFQKDVEFKNLRIAIIDEQHRFGVAQRLELGSKGQAVDVLVMTATPIPRSLALAQYGDMDVSILDEKPPGRKPIKTALISDERLDEVVNHLSTAISNGRQAYWVCPLVDESEVSDLTAAEERFKFLRSSLGEANVGLVHGQMHPKDKDSAMARFQSGEIKVLVATTVIEVGVNVPNATIIVIERAESFGLAQLHQLRGRVGRGSQESTCLLVYNPPLSQGGEKRLTTLRETEDGFKISEVDMQMRGAGDLIGTAQSGLPRFRIADVESQSGLMQTAQKDARNLLERDPKLTSERGKAARLLLWLMEQDRAIRLISVG